MMIEDFKPEEVEWCDTCRPHLQGKCDGCHTKFEVGEPGYRSQSHHFHPGSVDGVPGTYAIHKHLCLACYRKDFKHVYPKLKLPV
jgi:hypothetical protein